MAALFEQREEEGSTPGSLRRGRGSSGPHRHAVRDRAQGDGYFLSSTAGGHTSGKVGCAAGAQPAAAAGHVGMDRKNRCSGASEVSDGRDGAMAPQPVACTRALHQERSAAHRQPGRQTGVAPLGARRNKWPLRQTKPGGWTGAVMDSLLLTARAIGIDPTTGIRMCCWGSAGKRTPRRTAGSTTSPPRSKTNDDILTRCWITSRRPQVPKHGSARGQAGQPCTQPPQTQTDAPDSRPGRRSTGQARRPAGSTHLEYSSSTLVAMFGGTGS